MRLSPLIGLPPDASGPLQAFLSVLLGAASLVLIIASVNVAAMLSSKALARRREMAVRAALGATRLRLVRQLLTEILILFALGAAGGLALAYLGTSALERMPIPAEITFAPHLSPDARVFAFALAISLLTGLIVGLVPARRATHTDVATQLRDGAAAASARRTWLGNALVVSQLSASRVARRRGTLSARAAAREPNEPGVRRGGCSNSAVRRWIVGLRRGEGSGVLPRAARPRRSSSWRHGSVVRGASSTHAPQQR
ncbi:MAG TPA: FtsX-like permease family protein [Gemmatimonadaceae bacterium]